ncbi:hypothetical protein DVH24_028249 [Malus domestica]|uniref:non-specific serine/threonine protein kinase n=1 Tax=Malus domestica TaxID=3750 RepID=A0A498HDZ5_MALDO|nr:hypothetical protein DVH24_028249 [Malus domestica]
MSSSGQIRYLLWDHEKVWSLIWSDPRDGCSLYNTCGNFGSCNSQNGLVCRCLPGFKPTSPDNWNNGDYSAGCVRKSTICGNNAVSDAFLSLKMMKVGNPDSQFNAKSEMECKIECLNNCQCQAYSYEEVDIARRGGSNGSTCWIWSEDVRNLQEEYDSGQNLQVRVAVSDIESTTRNCETCGTNLIPYPLSTGPKCGDLTYYSFKCNTATGQVSFEAPSGTYKVTSINPDTQKFVIQAKNADNCRNQNFLQLNQSSPFHVINKCNAELSEFSSDFSFKGRHEVEISWDPPLEPLCSSSTDCRDWPRSTCNTTKEGTKRCLCTADYKWDSLTLNCTQEVGNGKKTGERRKKTVALIVVVTFVSVAVLAILSSTFVYAYLWRRRWVKRQEGREIVQKNSVLHFYDSGRKAWHLWKEEKALDLLEQTLRQSCNQDEYIKCVNVGLLCVQEDPGDRPTMSQVVFMLGSETATIPIPKQPAFIVRRCPSRSSPPSSSSKPETFSNNELTITLEDVPGKYIGANQTLVSPVVTFSLGFFFSPENSTKHLLGLWYNKIPKARMVWVANRDFPLNSLRFFMLRGDGNLVVLDSMKIVNATTGSLMNTGYLVLRFGQDTLWQSFDYPFDTYLRSMKLNDMSCHKQLGILPENEEVAIKMLSKKSEQGHEDSSTLILLGSCVAGKLRGTGNDLDLLVHAQSNFRQKISVYMLTTSNIDCFILLISKTSHLVSFVHSTSCFVQSDASEKSKWDWGKRFRIIEGVAQGVLYIHNFSGLKIIHRDLKASNILLDGAMNPKISDFGMARMLG